MRLTAQETKDDTESDNVKNSVRPVRLPHRRRGLAQQRPAAVVDLLEFPAGHGGVDDPDRVAVRAEQRVRPVRAERSDGLETFSRHTSKNAAE